MRAVIREGALGRAIKLQPHSRLFSDSLELETRVSRLAPLHINIEMDITEKSTDEQIKELIQQ